MDKVRGRALRAYFAVAAVMLAAMAGVTAGSAQAEYLHEFFMLPYTGSPSSTQAGGHPNIHTKFTVENHDEASAHGHPEACSCGDAANVITRLPAGVVGDPNNIPHCTQFNFSDGDNCSADTQVGVATPGIFFGEANVFGPGTVYEINLPVYNLEPHPGQAGLLGFYLPLVNSPAFIVLSARTGGDFGLNATFTGIEHVIPADGFALELWGVPAESKYDSERCTSRTGGFFGVGECATHGPSNAELKPFLDSPTTCEGPLSSSIEVQYYSQKVTTEEDEWPTSTGCDQLSFNPSLYAQPTTSATDSASGLEVDITVPQVQSPTAPSPSETRATTVTLPQGMAINPNAADGKTSCSDSQARIGTEREANCPETAKIGTVSLTSTALPGPIPGAIYLGDPQPGDRYRLILTANGFATHVKLIGSVQPDPKTGQLVVSFQNLPQSPFSDFNLHFFGSERGLLRTPTQCGTYPVTSTFTPWDEVLSEQTSTQYFTLNKGPDGGECPGSSRPFAPSLKAGVTDATGGVHSPFFVDLTRPDGDQTLAALNVSTPPGFSATLSGIPYCSDSALAVADRPGYSGLWEIANPSCPAASQVGTGAVGVGAGTHPIYLPSKVYLAGPYKGAPLSLAVMTPAVSGPYDLGNVVVRVALHVDATTAQVTAVSDPIPQILEGVPLEIRSVLINLDRKGFTLNPTNCSPFAVNSEAFGDQGAVARPSESFQVANCGALPFAPRFSLRFSGSTKRTGNPAVTANITYPSSSAYANVAATQVTLPASELIDNSHLRAPCTLKQFAQKACPPSTEIGFAKADTPLLEHPLEGPVYLRNGPHELPDIVAALSGQIGEIDLVGRVDSVKTRLRSTFEAVPDAPISHFTLRLDGGHKGLIESTEKLCATPQLAAVKMVGQNGKIIDAEHKIQLPCGKKSKKHRAKHHKAKRER